MRKYSTIYIIATLLIVVISSCLNEEFEKEILIQTGIANNIEIVTATLYGEIIDFGDGIDQYGHCWSTNQMPSINDSISIVVNEINGDYISQINNLLDETVYYYRSYAKKGSNVVYGEVSSFITLAYGIPIVGLNIQKFSYREISGNINLVNLGGYEQIDEIGVLCSKTPDITNEDSVIKFIEIDSIGKYNFNIENLDHNSRYYLKAFVKFKNGINYSSQSIINTVDGRPIVQLNIQNILYEEISGNINLMDLGAYDQIEQVGVCWSKETNPNIEDSIFSYNSINTIGNYSFNINNLDDGELYFIRAYAKYDNEILYTSEVEYSTLEYSLPEISINSVTNIDNISFTVNIETVDFGGCDLLENYGLCWGEMQNPTIDDNIIEFGSTSNIESKEVLLNGLDSLKTYYVKAFAINEKGISYSDEVSVRMTVIVSGGLIAYYPFDGNVNDYSGNENNATNYGATLNSDRFGNLNSAYKFDGSNDYMRIDHTEDLNFDSNLNSYTLSLWVKGSSESIETSRLIVKWNELLGTPYPFLIAATSTECFTRMYDVANTNIGSDCGNIWNDTWQQIILVVNVNTGFMNSYINKVLIGSTSISTIGSTANDVDIYIGGNLIGNRSFNGYIDDIRLYNRALSEDEIQVLYHEDGWDE